MKKKTERYILKKTSVPGRGGGPKIEAWYVFDTVTKLRVTTECVVKQYAENVCRSYNKVSNLTK